MKFMSSLVIMQCTPNFQWFMYTSKKLISWGSKNVDDVQCHCKAIETHQQKVLGQGHCPVDWTGSILKTETYSNAFTVKNMGEILTVWTSKLLIGIYHASWTKNVFHTIIRKTRKGTKLAITIEKTKAWILDVIIIAM